MEGTPRYWDGWRNEDGVRTVGVVNGDSLAACSDCDWSGWKATQAAARKAVHRHVAKTGHSGKVIQTRAYLYGPL